MGRERKVVEVGTVGELMDALAEYPRDMKVLTGGFDESWPVDRIMVSHDPSVKYLPYEEMWTWDSQFPRAHFTVTAEYGKLPGAFPAVMVDLYEEFGAGTADDAPGRDDQALLKAERRAGVEAGEQKAALEQEKGETEEGGTQGEGVERKGEPGTET